jgi:hypothetical protein
VVSEAEVVVVNGGEFETRRAVNCCCSGENGPDVPQAVRPYTRKSAECNAVCTSPGSAELAPCTSE